MAIFDSDSISLAPNISGYSSTYEDTVAYLRDIESYYERDGILIPTTPENFISVNGDSNIYLNDSSPSLVRVDTEIVSINSESSGDTLLISDTVNKLSLDINEDVEIFLDDFPPDTDPLDINLVRGTVNITLLNSSLSPDSVISIVDDTLTIDGFVTGLNFTALDPNINGNGIRIFTVESNDSLFEYGIAFEETTSPQSTDLTDPILFSDDDLIVSEQEFDVSVENITPQGLENLITESDLYIIKETSFQTLEPLQNSTAIENYEQISMDDVIEISNLVDLGLQDEIGDLI